MTILIPFWLNIGGVRIMKSGKYIGLTRVNYAPKSTEGGWAFGIFMHLILLCWPSKRGGYFTIQDLSFIRCIK